MDLPDIDTVETWLLCDFHRIKTQGRDRRADGMVEVDYATGAPVNERDLKPQHMAVRGNALALQTPVEPLWWAKAHLRLTDTPKDKWSEEDHYAVDELTYRIKLAVHRMSERGLFMVQPADPFDESGRPIKLGQDGLTIFAKITPKGLREAEEVARKNPRLATGPVSALHDTPDDVRLRAPDYLQAQWRKEARA